MKVKKIEINKLKPASYNPRQITTKQYNDLKESIKKFDLVDPIIINKDMTVIGGHQRLKVCKDLKHTEIDCVVLDLTKEEERELNIRLNKSGGEFDMDILANEFEIEELKDWGFKEIELGLNIDKIVEGNTEDDHIPEVKESRVKLGDVWELGKHRLMCGDSTKESDVEKLMNGEKADMVFTDPPYGMNFQSNFREKTPQFLKIENDDKILDIAPILLLNTKNNSAIYLCTRWDVYPSWYNQMDKSFNIKNCIVWYKKGGGLGDLKNSYSPNHEFIIVGHKGKAELKGKRYSDVWEIARDGFNDYKHPTQKPTALSLFAINNHSDKNNIVLDLFLGSGSTLIACEKTNRICYGMELDTKYCDVIIERWEQFTGQKANKCG
jgi:DNA modification methylase